MLVGDEPQLSATTAAAPLAPGACARRASRSGVRGGGDAGGCGCSVGRGRGDGARRAAARRRRARAAAGAPQPHRGGVGGARAGRAGAASRRGLDGSPRGAVAGRRRHRPRPALVERDGVRDRDQDAALHGRAARAHGRDRTLAGALAPSLSARCGGDRLRRGSPIEHGGRRRRGRGVAGPTARHTAQGGDRDNTGGQSTWSDKQPPRRAAAPLLLIRCLPYFASALDAADPSRVGSALAVAGAPPERELGRWRSGLRMEAGC
jgi:hypothetical protein